MYKISLVYPWERDYRQIRAKPNGLVVLRFR